MRELLEEEITAKDDVLGLYQLAGLGVPPAVPVLTLDWLRTGPQLVVPPPGGPAVEDPARLSEIAGRLAGLLGGSFATDLRPYLALARGFVAPAQRAAYGLREDPHTYGWLGVAEDGWHVQALGTAGGPCLISLIRPLNGAEATDKAGRPRYRPLGDPRALLGALVPALGLDLDDRSGQFEPDVFDTLLAGADVSVRCGVRQRLTTEGAVSSADRPFCYVLRLDFPPATAD
ncbi:hypothetical protein ACWED2_48000 [Amycolatopsis sp. NPDC005003]